MRRVVVLAAVAAFAAGSAGAADVRVDGSYRFRVNLNSNYLLDPTTPLGQTTWIEHRLRLTPKIVEQGQIEIQASFDILSGLLAGDLAPGFQHLGFTERSERNGTRAQGFDFRHLFAKLRLPVGIFEIGQMSSDWGMGVLTQGGNQEEGPDFGDIRFGDIVDRALFAFRPLTFLGPRSRLARTVALAVAGNLIYRDRYASLVTTTGSKGFAWGDTAFRLLSALVWDGLRAPILVLESAHHEASINYPSITSAWDVRFQVAIMLGILIFGRLSLSTLPSAATTPLRLRM